MLTQYFVYNRYTLITLESDSKKATYPKQIDCIFIVGLIIRF